MAETGVELGVHVFHHYTIYNDYGIIRAENWCGSHHENPLWHVKCWTLSIVGKRADVQIEIHAMDSLRGSFRKGDVSFCLNISLQGSVSSFVKKRLNGL